MKVLVCGSRGFNDLQLLEGVLDALGPTEIIHGDARGADRIAGAYAERLGIVCRRFPAAWETYGRRAGYVRNQQMLDEGQPDIVIAFWDGESKGTWNMIRLAEKSKIPVKVVYPEDKLLKAF